ncbi:CKLF-like MARVEL transmembrane domain-containing protein 7 isoform X1 [Diceros bicornis minor]|uniref:CKLF-like MARVEL transmembrane domain-containing protein 7 isoform X1 n=1 Tax=Diceros bicornis minor TaxID=77932 RepID=UPI0026EF3696|nr:CKLF-like MARVEL transmembrane domain-containing protein 7 isoform X1 [Diceros bicornis minor]
MSQGAGLVRTTCSSGSAPGPGAAASPSERLLDPVYPRTHAALLKVAQMVTLLIAFICVRSSPWTSYSAYSYFEVVTICNLIMILAFYLVHLFRLYRALTCISWPLSELLHYLIGTLLLLIASIVAASKSYSQSGLVAGAEQEDGLCWSSTIRNDPATEEAVRAQGPRRRDGTREPLLSSSSPPRPGTP